VRAVLAVWAAAGLLAGAAVPAAAAGRARQENLNLTGSLTIAWSGDPARGCAAAGQCGISGSLEILPTGQSSGSPSVPLEVSDDNAVARVTQRGPTGAVQATCVDLVPVDLTLVVRRTAAGLRAEAQNAFQPPSSGRCAGPAAADLSSFSVPARRLGAHSFDLSGQSSFGAGPFTVTVLSTVRAHITITRTASSGLGIPGSRPAFPRVRTRRVLEESAQLEYRVAGITGTLTTSFAGLPAPLCQPLGACGASGRLSDTYTAAGEVTFAGSRAVHRRIGTTGALADLHAGRMTLGDNFGLLRIIQTASETIDEGDGLACSDQLSQAVSGGSSGRRGSDQLVLAAPLQPLGGADPVRTRCPGPSQLDVLGESPVLARGTVSAGSLGAQQLAVTLSAGGAFTGSAYAGQRGGSIVLDLALVRVTGGTRAVKVISIAGRVVSVVGSAAS